MTIDFAFAPGGWAIAVITFGSIIVIRLLLAPYWIWNVEREARLAAETQLAGLNHARAMLCLQFADREPYRVEKVGWFYWKFAIYNDALVVADRVIVQLMSITPAPSDSQVVGLLDYPLALNWPPEFGSTHINSKGLEYFGICNAVMMHGQFEWCLNSIGRSQNSIPYLNISNGQEYEFVYRVEATNADTLWFTLVISASSLGVSIKEKEEC